MKAVESFSFPSFDPSVFATARKILIFPHPGGAPKTITPQFLSLNAFVILLLALFHLERTVVNLTN
jgi:hypothetical protein